MTRDASLKVVMDGVRIVGVLSLGNQVAILYSTEDRTRAVDVCFEAAVDIDLLEGGKLTSR